MGFGLAAEVVGHFSGGEVGVAPDGAFFRCYLIVLISDCLSIRFFVVLVLF